jgi:hypothetical protein
MATSQPDLETSATISQADAAAAENGPIDNASVEAAAAEDESGPVARVYPTETLAGEEPTSDTSVQIPRRGELTIALVTTKGTPTGSNWNSVALPKDAELLDVVEVHRAPDSTGGAVLLFPNKGEAIDANQASTGENSAGVPTSVGGGKGVSFRKVSASLWLIIA